MKIWTIILVVLLTGCQTTEWRNIRDPSLTSQDFLQDQQSCNLSRSGELGRIHCITDKGWRARSPKHWSKSDDR